jgi:hypothetical protein
VPGTKGGRDAGVTGERPPPTPAPGSGGPYRSVDAVLKADFTAKVRLRERVLTVASRRVRDLREAGGAADRATLDRVATFLEVEACCVPTEDEL